MNMQTGPAGSVDRSQNQCRQSPVGVVSITSACGFIYYMTYYMYLGGTRRTQTAFDFPCTLLLTPSSRFHFYNRVFVFLPDGMAESVPRSDS